MKALIGLTLAGIGFVVLASSAPGDELGDLRAQRIETLRQAVNAIEAQYRAGQSDVRELLAVQAELLDAKLDAASTPKLRIQVLKQQLELSASAEKLADARFRAGGAKQTDVLLAKAARLRVEVLLLKEEKQNAADSSSLNRDDAAESDVADSEHVQFLPVDSCQTARRDRQR